MKNIYSEYFRVISENIFHDHLSKDFETFFDDKYDYCSTRMWKNKINTINFYISFFLVEGKYFFNGSIYSKSKPSVIDFYLFMPMYYPDFPNYMFTPRELVESEVNTETDAFFNHFSIAIKSLPLCEIIKGKLWLDGFKHYPQDQVLGIPWTPPEKIKF